MKPAVFVTFRRVGKELPPSTPKIIVRFLLKTYTTTTVATTKPMLQSGSARYRAFSE